MLYLAVPSDVSVLCLFGAALALRFAPVLGLEEPDLLDEASVEASPAADFPVDLVVSSFCTPSCDLSGASRKVPPPSSELDFFGFALVDSDAADAGSSFGRDALGLAAGSPSGFADPSRLASDALALGCDAFLVF